MQFMTVLSILFFYKDTTFPKKTSQKLQTFEMLVVL